MAALHAMAVALALWLASMTAVQAALYRSEWQAFVTRFVAPEGRVIDTGNQGISHSEGQGYGMVLATAYDDRASFDRLWQWTRTNLQVRDDRLFAWKWEPAAGRVTDRNSAADGDLLIAWGLLRGAGKWNEPAYRAAALPILDDVRARLVVDTAIGRTLLPGPDGFVRDGSVVLNPSYWVFPALAHFAREHDSALWRAVIESGRRLIDTARFAAPGLPPDWVELAGTVLRLPSGFETVFGFNAIRVPLYTVWGGLDDATRLNGPVTGWWAGHDGQPFIPATLDLTTGTPAPYGLSSGGRAVSVLARFGAQAGALMPSLGETDDYYSATLILLAKAAYSERFQ